jgi:hypothetical protein
MGAIVGSLKVLMTPVEKRKGRTGVAEQLFFVALGLAILALAYFQGAELAANMNGLGF